jgi:hypothetical protein
MVAVGADVDVKVAFKTGGTYPLLLLTFVATVYCGASWRGRPEDSFVVGQWPRRRRRRRWRRHWKHFEWCLVTTRSAYL